MPPVTSENAPRRLALLVATYRYEDTGLRQLTAPGCDAETLAEVLRDPAIAGFDVTILLNEPHHVVGRAIGDFYRNRRRDDLTLLYFTGHGVKDDYGRLYLAMTNTQRDSLLFTALSAQLIDDAMESCHSRQKVLILDCCYSGAFPAGSSSKADPEVHTLERFQGKGRVVLTASDATQYSFEGDEISGAGSRSVFTHFLVEGLTTGEGDLDGDGDVCLDELYSYVYDRVIEEMPQQRPKKQANVEGRIVVARNVHWSFPAHLRNAMESPIAKDRLTALEGLAHLHRVGNEFVRAVVGDHVRKLTLDDSKAVSSAAMKLVEIIDSVSAQSKSDAQPATPEQISTGTPELPTGRTTTLENRQVGAGAAARRKDLPDVQKAPDRINDTGWRRQIILAVLIVLAGIAVFLFFSRQAPPPAAPAVNVSEIPIGANPFWVAVTPGGRQIYVANSRSGTVAVIDIATRRMTDLIDDVGDAPDEVAITRDGARIYVNNYSSDNVSVIDAATGSVVGPPIPVGDNPSGVAITPDGSEVYVSNSLSADVSVIDAASGAVAGPPIPVDGLLGGVAIDRHGNRVYVTNNSGYLSVIDIAGKTLTKHIPVGGEPDGVAVDQNSDYAYVANKSSNTVSVIDTAALEVVDTIDVGRDPRGVAVSPDSRYVYVANTNSHNVSMIDTSTREVVETIDVGLGPRGVVVSPDSRYVYVANSLADYVSVIEIIDQ